MRRFWVRIALGMVCAGILCQGKSKGECYYWDYDAIFPVAIMCDANCLETVAGYNVCVTAENTSICGTPPLHAYTYKPEIVQENVKVDRCGNWTPAVGNFEIDIPNANTYPWYFCGLKGESSDPGAMSSYVWTISIISNVVYDESIFHVSNSLDQTGWSSTEPIDEFIQIIPAPHKIRGSIVIDLVGKDCGVLGNAEEEEVVVELQIYRTAYSAWYCEEYNNGECVNWDPICTCKKGIAFKGELSEVKTYHFGIDFTGGNPCPGAQN